VLSLADSRESDSKKIRRMQLKTTNDVQFGKKIPVTHPSTFKRDAFSRYSYSF